ncbi:von Willebrand factor type D domain [Trinorchestia longiramus]|nr:von Willebrand factor type D domain [Trinorchestia longiramus]
MIVSHPPSPIIVSHPPSFIPDEADGELPSDASEERRDLADFNLNDTPQRRGRKLLMLTGSGGSLVTALANCSSGSHDILYEALLASTPPNRSALGLEERRYHLTFFRSGVPDDIPRPPKVCVQLEFTTPQLPPLDRLDKLLQDPLQATLSGVLIVGTSCRVSKQTEVGSLKVGGICGTSCRVSKQTEVGSLKIQLAISPKELHQLARHLPGLCHFDRLDPTASLRRAAFYDSLQLDLSWKQEIPKTVLNESYALTTVLQSLTLPYTASNCLHVDSPQRRVLVNLTRSHTTKRATGWISRPGCLDYVEEMPFPPLVDFFLPLHGQPSQDPQGEVRNSHNPVLPPSDQCYVLPNRIVTFDGVSYDVSPSTCSRVIFNDVSDDASVLITSQGDDDSSLSPQRYRILLPRLDLDIHISRQTVQVNGESISEAFKEISRPSGDTAAAITKTSEAVEVLLPGTLYVLVKTSNSLVLRVLDPALYRGAVRGLCGDFNGDTMGDLKGPRECLFTPSQGELMAVAWTLEPCSPPPAVVDQLKRQQWTCPRTPAELSLPGGCLTSSYGGGDFASGASISFTVRTVLWGHYLYHSKVFLASKDYDPESCEHEVHKVISRPGQVCLTTVPVSVCASHCSSLPGTEREAMFEVKCWSEEHLPDSLKRAQKEGYLPYLEEAPGVLLPTLLSYPMECIPTRKPREL